ncbi:MAG TPA: twin-arginine translocation signal domain-containing protein, partial [Dehalococcoidia bacterium]|nr:twin-arginine translocation signal domain-containing protein [Dehalococcoidia bacterium]
VSQESATPVQSRRSFLVKLGLGVVGLAGISSGLVRFSKKESTASTQEFPGPDSIFHPAQDPRTDPRRG